MKRMDKITIAVTLAIIFCLYLIPVDKTFPLSIIGMVFVVVLPGYIYYRRRKSEKDNNIAWEATQRIKQLRKQIERYEGRPTKKLIDGIYKDIREVELLLDPLERVAANCYIVEE